MMVFQVRLTFPTQVLLLERRPWARPNNGKCVQCGKPKNIGTIWELFLPPFMVVVGIVWDSFLPGLTHDIDEFKKS